MKMPELLAPVGGMAHLTAAVNNGADAVYMGGTAFNARIFADNFRDDELPEAIEYAHLRGVKVYITFNTLLKDAELVRAFEYANYLSSIGADGLIVQDMGLARLVHKYIPALPLHLSTQGTLYNKEAIGLARKMGFIRVVPARELGLDELRELASPDENGESMEVEIFVHGALCMCYSGQCQMSRMLGSSQGQGSPRSGNRGTCAQPCRQLYTDENGLTSYALSPRDLCQIENIPDLVMSGAASFKIEGRMKSPEYVAIVTGIYRKYIDRYESLVRKYGADKASEHYSVEEEDMFMLRQIFSRGNFTSGYLYGDPGDDLLSGMSPKNQGIYAGRVASVIDSEHKVSLHDERMAAKGALKRGKVLVYIAMDRKDAAVIRPGDGLEFRSDDDLHHGSSSGGVTTYVKTIGSGATLAGDFDRGMSTGDMVYKVTDRQLIDRALEVPEKKLPVTMLFTAREGQYPVLHMTDIRSGYSTEVTADHIVERARKTPTEQERIVSGLARLGDTPYTAGLTGIDVEIDDDIMMPVSIINRMRREAADELMRHRRKSVYEGRKVLSRGELDVIESGEMLGASVLDEDHFRKNASGRLKPVPVEDYLARWRTGNTDPDEIPYILNVSKGSLDRFIRDNFDEIAEACRPCGVLIGNLGWIEKFLEAGVKVYGDYGLNVYNEQARRAFEDAGVEVYMLSHETGISDSRGIPLMITEHRVDASVLTDRKGSKHRVVRSASGDKTLIY